MKTASAIIVAVSLAAPAGASAADSIPVGAEKAYGEAAFLDSCPVTKALQQEDPDGRSIVAAVLASIVQQGLTKAAEAASEWAAKENQKLNAVVTYSGYANLYSTVEGGRIKAPAGCLIIARYPKTRVTDDVTQIEDRLAPYMPVFRQAGFSVFGEADSDESGGSPDFYAEFMFVPALGVTGDPGSDGFAAFSIKPTFVYFGASAARRPVAGTRKSLRAEIDLTRLKLDTGALAEKPYYSAGFDLSTGVGLQDNRMATRTQLLPRQLSTANGGPLAVYPAPAELKATVAFRTDGALVSGKLVDQVPTRITVQVIEAEEPSFIMKALAKASADNKDKMLKAAEAASSRIAAAIEEALGK
jgi:hypothetical protein